MSKIYCMNCGTPTEDAFAKFCVRCGKPYITVSSVPSSQKIEPKKEPMGIDQDEDHTATIDPFSLKEIGFDMNEITPNQPRRETIGDVAKTPKTGFKREKEKRVSKKKFLEDFKAEAGTSRRK